MKQLIKYLTESGSEVFIEVGEPATVKTEYEGMQDVGVISDKAGEVINVVEGSFEKSLSSIYAFSEIITKKLKDLEPQKVEVEFGIKFSATAGAFITALAAEANLKITLSWENSKT